MHKTNTSKDCDNRDNNNNNNNHKNKTKIKIALLQHSLLHDSNVIPIPKGSISSLLHYGAVRKEKLDPATGGSKKNDHCTAETLV